MEILIFSWILFVSLAGTAGLCAPPTTLEHFEILLEVEFKFMHPHLPQQQSPLSLSQTMFSPMTGNWQIIVEPYRDLLVFSICAKCLDHCSFQQGMPAAMDFHFMHVHGAVVHSGFRSKSNRNWEKWINYQNCIEFPLNLIRKNLLVGESYILRVRLYKDQSLENEILNINTAPSSEIAIRLYDDLKRCKQSSADVILRFINRNDLYAHKAVLTLNSSYMSKLISVSRQENGFTVIHMDNYDIFVGRVALEYLYVRNIGSNVAEQILCDTIVFATQYQLPELREAINSLLRTIRNPQVLHARRNSQVVSLLPVEQLPSRVNSEKKQSWFNKLIKGRGLKKST